MTCIVAILENGICYIGGDAAGSESNNGNIAPRTSPKVFQRNDYIMGYTTSFRLGDILEFVCPPPEVKSSGISLREHLVTKWIPVLREHLKKEGFMEVKDSRDKAGTFIVGYHGEVCTVYDDLQVSQLVTPYSSVGSGYPYALGALFATVKTNLKPKQRILLALNAAQFHNAYVREPFTVLHS